MKFRKEISPLFQLFQTEVKSLSQIANRLEKNKEILVLILSFRLHVNNKTSSSKLLYQLLKVSLRVTTVPYLLMGKLVLVRHIQCKVVKLMRNKEVSFQELSIMSLVQLKVHNDFISGTPGVNFMVQVSMLELYNEEISDLLSSDQTKKLQIH